MNHVMSNIKMIIILRLSVVLSVSLSSCDSRESQSQREPSGQEDLMEGASTDQSSESSASRPGVDQDALSEDSLEDSPSRGGSNRVDETEINETEINETDETGSLIDPDDPTRVEDSTQRGFINLSAQITDNPTHRRYGLAITDFDLNGDYEVIVTGYGAANEVYDHRDGQWFDIAPVAIKDEARQAIGVAACDVDGDGAEEIYFLNVDRFGGLGEVSDRLFRRDLAGSWTDLFEDESNQGVLNRFSGRSVACLDRNGDQRYGVFVANYGGPMKLFELQDEERLVDVGPEVGINLTTGGRALIALPRPESGMHIFAGNEGGANFLFINQGGRFEEQAQASNLADPQETVRGVATLDVNEDGLFDLVYGNWEGPHRLLIAQPPTRDQERITYEDQAPEALRAPSKIRTVIAADFDNDGYEELFFNNIGEPNRMFRRSGDSWVSVELNEALEPDGLGTGAAVADTDQDGLLELWIAHGESGAQPLSLFQWRDQGYHWLRVAPLTSTGAPARGARVTLYHTQGRVQRRVIDAGSGYLCQMEPVAHFGLGEDTHIDRALIEWVDGSRLELNQVEVDQVIRVMPNR